MTRAGYRPPPLQSTLLSPYRWRIALREAVAQRSFIPFATFAPQIAQAERVFDELLTHPEGRWLAEVDPERNFDEVRMSDGRIQLHVSEMAEWIDEITPEAERAQLEMSEKYPFVLNAGRHKPENANTLMRDPAWNKGRRACTLAMHPDDAADLGIVDGEKVRVVTEAGIVVVELEVTPDTRKGLVLMPHGFGLKHAGEIYGTNVNRLTLNTHRDRIAATPLHRFVPCRVEPLSESTAKAL